MKSISKKTVKSICFGFFAGAISAFAGSGGGIVTVLFLKSEGLTQKAAQQNAVAVILPIAAISASFYILKGYAAAPGAIPLLPAGLLGAVCGAYFINKIPSLYLKTAFGAFMIYAGGRLLL